MVADLIQLPDIAVYGTFRPILPEVPVLILACLPVSFVDDYEFELSALVQVGWHLHVEPIEDPYHRAVEEGFVAIPHHAVEDLHEPVVPLG